MAVRHGKEQARPTYTPLVPGTTLVKLTYTSGCAQHPLAEVVGELMHVRICTRPGIMYAVGMLGRHSTTPDSTHWNPAMHVIRYLTIAEAEYQAAAAAVSKGSVDKEVVAGLVVVQAMSAHWL